MTYPYTHVVIPSPTEDMRLSRLENLAQSYFALVTAPPGVSLT